MAPGALAQELSEEQQCKIIDSLAESINQVERVKANMESSRVRALEQRNLQTASVYGSTVAELSMILEEMKFKYEELEEVVTCDAL